MFFYNVVCCGNRRLDFQPIGVWYADGGRVFGRGFIVSVVGGRVDDLRGYTKRRPGFAPDNTVSGQTVVLGYEEILEKMSENSVIVVVEEVCSGSGIREALAWELTKLCPECIVYGMDLGADFVPHGNQKLLYKHCGLDEASIARFVKEVLSHEN